MVKLGLRVDVDTFRGTRDGVPRLLELFAQQGIRATFFFSVGPDNMGRHLWRLIKPQFFLKMVRSNAPRLYGWSILGAGTFWPGQRIGRKLAAIIRETESRGHEVGLHAWDHYAWQTHLERWSVPQLQRELVQGLETLSDILNGPISCSAAPGWRAEMRVIGLKAAYPFRYNSDCRGYSLFRPVSKKDDPIPSIQIPVSLPTFDEAMSQQVAWNDYNAYLWERLLPQCEWSVGDSFSHPVYTIHAEVEGGVLLDQFESLLMRVTAQGILPVPLGSLLPNPLNQFAIPHGTISKQFIPGREGWVGCQQPAAAVPDGN